VVLGDLRIDQLSAQRFEAFDALLHGSTAGRSQFPQQHLWEANVLRPAKLEHPV
jgi:hypothetical protein